MAINTNENSTSTETKFIFFKIRNNSVWVPDEQHSYQLYENKTLKSHIPKLINISFINKLKEISEKKTQYESPYHLLTNYRHKRRLTVAIFFLKSFPLIFKHEFEIFRGCKMQYSNSLADLSTGWSIKKQQFKIF